MRPLIPICLALLATIARAADTPPAKLNIIFMLVDDERLTAFVDEVARRNGGRVLRAQPERLGEFVVKDFLRTRHAHRR